jgi:hypothetical protein
VFATEFESAPPSESELTDMAVRTAVDDGIPVPADRSKVRFNIRPAE